MSWLAAASPKCSQDEVGLFSFTGPALSTKSAAAEALPNEFGGAPERVSDDRPPLTVIRAESVVSPWVLEQLQRLATGAGCRLKLPSGLDQTATFVGVKSPGEHKHKYLDLRNEVRGVLDEARQRILRDDGANGIWHARSKGQRCCTTQRRADDGYLAWRCIGRRLGVLDYPAQQRSALHPFSPKVVAIDEEDVEALTRQPLA